MPGCLAYGGQDGHAHSVLVGQKIPRVIGNVDPLVFAEDEFNVRLTCLRCKPSELAPLTLLRSDDQ